ncbi:MAG: hypothetical protein ACF8MJ_04805 [Phycisphaerales bacterium JB050]
MNLHDQGFGFNGRRIVVTAMVSALAAGAGVLGGCNGSSESAFFSNGKGGAYSEEALAAQATVNIDPSETQGQFTSNWYNEQAGQVNLPDRWLGEALSATAENEARRAAAQAALVENDATRFERLAAQNAQFTQAETNKNVGWYKADELNSVYSAKLEEMEGQARSRELANIAQQERNNAEVAISSLEWQNQFERMYAEAERAWAQAQGDYQKMLAERQAVEERGRFQIEQMETVADMTAERAENKVSQLRAEANSVSEHTAAQVAALNKQIETAAQRFEAQASEYANRATTLDEFSEAKSKELRALAKALEEQDVNGAFEVALVEADTNFDRAKAEAERMMVAAEALNQSTRAEVDRIRAESDMRLAIGETNYQNELAAIERFVEHGEAEIAFRRAEADRIEREARAEFIKAEAAARANAIRESSRHQQVLTENERKLITAEAEAEARRIQSDLYRELANQAKRGSSALPGKTDPKAPGASNNDSTPELAEASGKPAVLEPERVARFKGALAEAAAIRKHEEAAERDLYATVQERTTQASAWWDQQVAKHNAELARADSIQRKGSADIEELFLQAESMIAQAEAERSRSVVAAEAAKRETLAQIVNLTAQAEATDKTSEAQIRQFLARASAAESSGSSEVRSLIVQRDSAKTRGEAEAKRLLAEADSLEKSQRAVVAQMRQEIKTAEQQLEAELARLDQVAESFIAIAEATYNEASFIADTFAKVSQANTTELAASHEAEALIADSNVEYMHSLRNATKLAASAAVSRALADATYEFATFQAEDTGARSRILAESRMAEAAANAQFQIASAQDQAVRSLFDSRIVQTESERNRAFANQYLAQMQSKASVEKAMAAAAAYQDLSNEAIARLNQRAVEFSNTAQVNWDERLAMAKGKLPTVEGAEALYLQALRDLENSQATYSPNPMPVITNVPVNLDN